MMSSLVLFSSDLDGETDGFLASVRGALPVPTVFSSHIRDTTTALANFLNRTNFVINTTNPEVNTTVIILSIFDGVRTLINGVDALSANAKTCINNLITNVSKTAISGLGKDLEQMRRSYTLLSRIENFLRNYANSERTFKISDIPKTCVRRAVEISFCRRCQQVLPPLCFNTCGALVRGCYAPYVTGLRNHFNRLWNIARQAVNILRLNADRIVKGTSVLIDSTKVS